MKSCCGTSVGVIIQDAQGRYLMIERGWYPTGIAPVAGHVRDAHSDPAEALVAEVSEEVGLSVTSHRTVWEGWLPNLCASPPARIPGHHWTVVTATVTGELAPDPTETRGARWYGAEEVFALVSRTVAYALGRQVSEAEWRERPGLEPVWLELLHQAGVLPLLQMDRDLMRRLYTTPPTAYWLGEERGLVPAHDLAAQQ